MIFIKEIASIVAENQPESPEIILKSRAKLFEKSSKDLNSAKDSAYYRAYNALINDRINTEEELRSLVFPDGTSDANFRSFKSRLKKRLVNSLMLIMINADEVSNTDASEGEALYLLYTSYVASVMKNSFIALKLSEMALEVAQRYDMFYIELRILENLLIETSIKGKKKEYEECYNHLLDAQTKYNLHLKAVAIRYRVEITLRGHFAVSTDQIVVYEQATKDLEAVLSECEFDSAMRAYYWVASSHALMTNDFEKTLAVCTRYEDYLGRKPHFNSPSRRLKIAEQQQRAYFHTGQYELSKNVMEDALDNLPASRKALKITKRLFSLHNAVYFCDCEYAFEQCVMMGKKQNIHWLSPRSRAHLVLLRAYLWLEYFVGMAEASIYPTGIERKDIQAFIAKRPLTTTILNDIPEFDHDVEGGKVVAKIYQAIMRVLELREDVVHNGLSGKKLVAIHDACIQEMETFRRYIHEYVSAEHQKRVYAFTDILFDMALNITDSAEVIRICNAERLYKLPDTLLPDDDELIPFGMFLRFFLKWWDTCSVLDL